MPRLILASASPYRRQLLERLGIPFDVRPADADESAVPGEDAPTLAARLATAKAQSIRTLNDDADEIIIGADQVAALDGELLRKPGDHDTALRQLSACQGETVVFSTATTVIDCNSGRQWYGLDSTAVVFLKLSQAHLSRYLELEQPYDCAGGFKAEGLGISLFRSIRSEDPTALLGLPLIWLTQVFRDLELDPLDSSRR
jgi:septum formation protein